jgi:hypothetical protein
MVYTDIDKICDILRDLRKERVYPTAVQDLTSLNLNTDKSAAFLIQLIASCLGRTKKTDIVLASFGLLEGYGETEKIDERRKMIKKQIHYEGESESLYQIEKTCYKHIAKYFLPFYKDVEGSKKLLDKALTSDYYDIEHDRVILPGPFSLAGRITTSANLKNDFGFTEEQAMAVDWLLNTATLSKKDDT